MADGSLHIAWVKARPRTVSETRNGRMPAGLLKIRGASARGFGERLCRHQCVKNPWWSFEISRVAPGFQPFGTVGILEFFNRSGLLSHGSAALHLFNIKNGECCYLYEAVPILFFCCKDCGLDCSFQATGMTQQEIARKIIQHMDTVHGMNVIPADFMIKIKHAIKNKNPVKTVSLVPETVPLVVSIR